MPSVLTRGVPKLLLESEIMALRQQTVEHPFADIKHRILGNARLLMRGLQGARRELSLAVLASEYPETFRKIREDLPYYIERGTRVFDLASQVGRSIAAKSRNGRFDLMNGFSSYT